MTSNDKNSIEFKNAKYFDKDGNELSQETVAKMAKDFEANKKK